MGGSREIHGVLMVTRAKLLVYVQICTDILLSNFAWLCKTRLYSCIPDRMTVVHVRSLGLKKLRKSVFSAIISNTNLNWHE